MYVSTEQNGVHSNENFQLTAGTDTLLLHGVLCENGEYLLTTFVNSDFGFIMCNNTLNYGASLPGNSTKL